VVPTEARPLASSKAPIPHFDVTVEADALEDMYDRKLEDVELAVTVDYRGRRYPGVTLQLHGGYARLAPKKSFRLTFDDDDELPVTFFEGSSGKYRRLVLLASWIDPTWMRNRLTMDIGRDLGGLSPRMAFGTLAINGAWQGLYVVAERIDKQYLGRNGLARDADLYKAVSHFANWQHKSEPTDGYEKKLAASRSDAALAELLDAATHTPASYADFVRFVEPRLKLGDFMVWQAANIFASNGDAFTKNYYLARDPAASSCAPGYAFSVINWDADATWGNDWRGEPKEITARWHGHDRLAPRLFSIPTYRERYVALLRAGLETHLARELMERRVDVLAEEIREAAVRDLARWRRDVDFDVEVARLRSIAGRRAGEMRSLLAEVE